MFECNVVAVNPILLAVTETFTTQPEIPARIRSLFDIVYAWLPQSGVQQTGHNHALYDQFSGDVMRMRVGFPVSERFTGSGSVSCLELAGGRAAHMTHCGPYSGLAAAHSDLNRWCVQRSLQLAGESWEVYGDWNEDETQLLTDIYLRLL